MLLYSYATAMEILVKPYFLSFSDYYRNPNITDPYKYSAVAGEAVNSALWKLSLALIFKMIITIFTFGIKVLVL